MKFTKQNRGFDFHERNILHVFLLDFKESLLNNGAFEDVLIRMAQRVFVEDQVIDICEILEEAAVIEKN